MSQAVKVVVFDFDGVFVEDSEAVFKEIAWKKAIRPYIDSTEIEAVLDQAHKLVAKEGGGRTEIVSAVLKKSAVPSDQHQFATQEILNTFTTAVEEAVMQAGLTESVPEVLNFCKLNSIPAYLNSGTDTKALKKIVSKLELHQYLTDSLGSTPDPVGGDKVLNLQHIAEQHSVGPIKICFIGDNYTDWEAAQKFGCHFIGFSNRHNNWFAKKALLPFKVVSNMRDLLSQISEKE